MTIRDKLKRLESSPEQQEQVQSIMQLQELLKKSELSQLPGQAEAAAEIFAKAYSEAIAAEIMPVSIALSSLTEEAKSTGRTLHQVLNRASTDLPELTDLINSQTQPLIQLQASLDKLRTLGICLVVLMSACLLGIMLLILKA